MTQRRFISMHPKMIERFGDPFRPLEPECKVVQFGQPLTPEQLQRAGELMRGRPDVRLYVHGRASHDLDFLRYFPGLRSLQLAIYELDDIAGFSHVEGSLSELIFGRTKNSFSLRFLVAMPQLKTLVLEGHRKDLASIET
jgi:hypothetical protein